MNDRSPTPFPSPYRGEPPRRSMLLATVALAGAGVLAMAKRALSSATAAGLNDARFIELSKTLTGHADLDSVTASRLLAGLRTAHPGFDARLSGLADLAGAGGDPEAILARAEEAGLKEAALMLVAAWYTGSVANATNAPMVAYHDALMYRPTRDALPVPTYCFDGPAWWTREPPPLGVAIPGPGAMVPPPPAGVLHPPAPQRVP